MAFVCYNEIRLWSLPFAKPFCDTFCHFKVILFTQLVNFQFGALDQQKLVNVNKRSWNNKKITVKNSELAQALIFNVWRISIPLSALFTSWNMPLLHIRNFSFFVWKLVTPIFVTYLIFVLYIDVRKFGLCDGDRVPDDDALARGQVVQVDSKAMAGSVS